MRRRKDELRIPPVLQRSDVDAMAKRRCLMLLMVLSGQESIAQAISDAELSATAYYQLEKKALLAMLAALTPDSTTSTSTSWQMVSKLEKRVKELEIDKRRLERLLALTRKVVKPGPLKPAGARRSKRRSAVDATTKKDQDSTSTPGGGAGS